MHPDRRSVLAALGAGLPFTVAQASPGSPAPADPPPVLRLVSFEEAVRAAFSAPAADGVRRVAVGYSEVVQAGLQGCVNSRPFAGFPAGWLRIVRSGSGPGPAVGGVRLLVSTVDVTLTFGHNPDPSRRLDFAALPPAPTLTVADAGTGLSHRSNPRRG